MKHFSRFFAALGGSFLSSNIEFEGKEKADELLML